MVELLRSIGERRVKMINYYLSVYSGSIRREVGHGSSHSKSDSAPALHVWQP